MTVLKVLQWNCRSLGVSRADLNYLLSHTSPHIVLIQETWLTPQKSFRLHNFRSFRLDRDQGRGGGLLTLISSKLCHKVSLSFHLMSPIIEALVLDVHIDGIRPFSIANVYFPVGVTSTTCLDDILSNSQRQLILAGDFNSHHACWGFRTDTCGRRLWSWAMDNDFQCVNSRSATFLRGGVRSALDLTFASNGISLSDWTTMDCGTNSDHLPVAYSIIASPLLVPPSERKFVNHDKFKKVLLESFQSIDRFDSDEKAVQINSILCDAIHRSEFTVKSSNESKYNRWWTKDCDRAHRRRKAAWKSLLCNQCPANWSSYKFYAANFKRVVAESKLKYYSELHDALSNPKRRKELFRFMANNKPPENSMSVASVVLSPREAQDNLDVLARGLASRLMSSSVRPFHRSFFNSGFFPVSRAELETALSSFQSSASGPDGVTVRMLKFLGSDYTDQLLAVLNKSIKSAWIPQPWKLAKVILVLKNTRLGYEIDNIRPIALTSNLVKLVEKVLHARLMTFIASNNILSSCQIGFRPECSIWFAHVDLESRIRLARKMGKLSALVTLDVAKAYDSVEYEILLERLMACTVPPYIIAWVQEFLRGREFFCTDGRLKSDYFPQTRGVPQGSVLSPVLFNILLSSIPRDPEVTVYVYADDIAFYACDDDVHSLYQRLQTYLDTLTRWLQTLHLALNVKKCCLLVFPVQSDVSISLAYQNQIIKQVNTLKYLGVMYDPSLSWCSHIESTLLKGERALGRLRRLAHSKSGMRRETLLILYKLYVRPILEFGCALYSGTAAYKLRPLYMLEKRALRLLLGLPRFVADTVLYLEAQLPTLETRFQLLSVKTYLRMIGSPIGREQAIFLQQPLTFLTTAWPRFRRPQLLFVNSILSYIGVDFFTIQPLSRVDTLVPVHVDNIYSQRMPSCFLGVSYRAF